MHLALLDHVPGLSAYIAEILRAWGVRCVRRYAAGDWDGLDPRRAPVAIVPAGTPVAASLLAAYVERGGTLIAIVPEAALARVAGLIRGEALPMPRRLRLSRLTAAGWAGEAPPVVGAAFAYEANESAETVAHLFATEEFESETPGITVSARGQGRIISFAFDLPRCVLLLRQGDPALAEQIPAGDTCWRPTHMAAVTGVHDAGWVPYADLLGRLLVEFATAGWGAPLPVVDHLPHGAPGIVLYSGDEDTAPLAAINEQLDWLTAQGARMDLNIIPDATESTAADVQRYRQHHDVNPHPNLRALDGRPVAERLDHLERQIRLFREKFGGPTISLRNHGTAWCGYLEHVEVLERCGMKMDTDYFSGSYKRRRDAAPYNPFGGALPLRFGGLDGRLLGVFQQHTPLADDVYFAPEEGRYRQTRYSYRLSPAAFEVMLERIYRDIVERFHTPLGVCIHPGNWVAFSRPQGQALVLQAKRFGLPVWSFSQWCRFWMRRDGWQIDDLAWAAGRLSFAVRGGEPDQNLRLAVPGEFQGRRLGEVRVDGKPVAPQRVRRYGQEVGLVAVGEKDPSRLEVDFQ